MCNLERALSLCRGVYQRAIVRGQARLSGADLRGKAKQYSARYAQSRKNLLARLRAEGLAHEVCGPHNRRILVID